MKAAYKSKRDRGIEISDLPKPEIYSNEILIKVKSGAICGTDIHLYEWNNWCENVKAKNPMVIGHEFCGEVIETGENVNLIEAGDLVAAETHIPCGQCKMCRTGREHICHNMKIIGVHRDGAFAEFAKIPAVCAWKLPAGTAPEIGAIYEPFGIAVHAVLKGNIAGSTVAVSGCGPIGLFAINVASLAGAKKIIATDINDFRLNLAKKMGDNVIAVNPEEQSLSDVVDEQTEGQGVDAAFEISGSIAATQSCFNIIGKSGWISLVGLQTGKVPLDLVKDVIYKEISIYGITGREMYDSWYRAEDFITSGNTKISDVITHKFELSEIEEAILLAQSGECGKVIIEIS